MGVRHVEAARQAAQRVTREPLSAMAFDPTGRTVACGDSEGHVLIVDAKTLAIKKTIGART